VRVALPVAPNLRFLVFKTPTPAANRCISTLTLAERAVYDNRRELTNDSHDGLLDRAPHNIHPPKWSRPFRLLMFLAALERRT
jgi:hypothetical protein